MSKTTTTVHVELYADVTHELLRDATEGSGFDFYWAVLYAPVWGRPAKPSVAFEIGWWDDGEQWQRDHMTKDGDAFDPYGDGKHVVIYHQRTITYDDLAEAAATILRTHLVKDAYQVRALRDLLLSPDEFDGDALTADYIIQVAAFGEVAFG